MKCNFALQLIRGRMNTYGGMVSGYAEAAMITQENLKDARNTVGSYKALLEAGEAPRMYIESDAKNQDAVGKFWKIKGGIYMALK